MLATLEKTRQDARTMKEDIGSRQRQYEEVREQPASLLRQLTAWATVLEKLKTKCGEATALNAFLQMNELSDEEEEEDDLLAQGTILILTLTLIAGPSVNRKKSNSTCLEGLVLCSI